MSERRIADTTRDPKLDEYMKGVERRMESAPKLQGLVKESIDICKTLLSAHQKECNCFACERLRFKIKLLQSLIEESEKCKVLEDRIHYTDIGYEKLEEEIKQLKEQYNDAESIIFSQDKHIKELKEDFIFTNKWGAEQTIKFNNLKQKLEDTSIALLMEIQTGKDLFKKLGEQSEHINHLRRMLNLKESKN